MAAGTPAITQLRRAGVAHSLHPYAHDPRAEAYGEEAAARLGVPAQQLFKTLIAAVDGRLACAVVPVSGRLDLKAVASALGAKKAVLADPGAAQRSSGYVVGGISPLGQKTRIATLLDTSAMSFATVFVSAGRRGLQVELAPGDLVRLSGATVADIATG